MPGRLVKPGRLSIAAELVGRSYQIGGFVLRLHALGLELTSQLPSAQSAARPIWSSPEGRSFIEALRGTVTAIGKAGHLRLVERPAARYGEQSLDEVAVAEGGLRLSGSLRRSDGAAGRVGRAGKAGAAGQAGQVGQVGYSLLVRAIAGDQVELSLALLPPSGEATPEGAGWWCELHWSKSPGARQFGLGVQFSHLDLNGRRVPVVTAEQGVGRGDQPITLLANLKGGAGGDWSSTYAPAPVLLSSDLRGLYLTDTALMQFDLRARASGSVRVYAAALCARVFAGSRPAELLEIYTRFSGRMPPLPDWAHAGAIVGLQGGSEKAERVVAALGRHRAPVAGVWLQDWVGNRSVGFGQRLWWDWQLDRQRYPDWEGMVRRLGGQGVAVLVYTNPFLADMRLRPGGRPDLYQAAAAAGCFVTDHAGRPYQVDQGDFSAGLIDLSSEAARSWYLETLSAKLAETGALGWMADFGEGLPLDASLAGGEADAWHNRYPQEWASFNAELRQRLAQRAGRPEGEFLTFFRSGYAQSPRHARLFWLGDQNVTWGRHDGLKSALTGLLSSGFSGFSLQHGDVGGYTSFTLPSPKLPLLKMVRDRELLARWGELMAFTVVLRSHEGNQPARNLQVYSNDQTLADFARAARLHAAWRELRGALMREAFATGMPVARHPWLVYPDDPVTASLSEQFLLGSALLVAPVLGRGATRVRAYLPAGSGSWQHVFSQERFEAEAGRWVEVAAPVGRPGLFVNLAQPEAPGLAERMREAVAESE